MQVAEKLLESNETTHAATDAYIVERLRAAIAELKRCVSEEQHKEYLTILAAVAAERESEHCQLGMIRKVAHRLGVQRGARYHKSSGERRPRAFDRAISSRATFDSSGVPLLGNIGPSLLSRRIEVGERALSRGRQCTVIEIDYEADTCKLRFDAEGESGLTHTRTFSSLGSGRGGSRLTRPALLLKPKVLRDTRCDEKAEKARSKVEEFLEAQGARSPERRDMVRHCVGVGLYQQTQALILYSTYAALYALFLKTYPMVTISFTLFKALRPWYVRRAKREVCLCKQCENYKYYKEVLHSLPKVWVHTQVPGM